MPRDGSGAYTLPVGNPVLTGTLIESSWANSTLSDIAVQLNNVLTRDGVLGPVLPFKLVDGAVATPGLAFSSEPGLGFYRRGTSQISFAAVNSTPLDFDFSSILNTILSIYPRSGGATASSQLVFSNKPFGTANASSLNMTVDDTAIKMTAATTGTGPKLPMKVDALVTGVTGENLLINPQFQINQLSSPPGAIAPSAYWVDGWYAGTGGANVSVSTVAGLTTVTINTGSLIQRIDPDNIDAGDYVASWTGTAQGKFNGGSFAASPAKIAGVAGASTTLWVEFGPGTLTRAKVELGTSPTTYYRPNRAEDLQRCMVYCKTSYESGAIPGSVVLQGAVLSISSSTASYGLLQRQFDPPFRNVPTMFWYNPATGVPNEIYNQTSGASYGVFPTSLSKAAVSIQASVAPNPSQIISCHFVALDRL